MNSLNLEKFCVLKKRKRKQCIIRQNNKKYLTHKRNLKYKIITILK